MNINLNSKPQFKKSLYAVKLSKSRIMFAFTKNENIIYKFNSDLERKIFKLLDGSHTIKEIYLKLKDSGINCSIDEIVKEIKKLYNLYLIDLKEIENSNRFSRQELFWGIQSKDGYKFAKEVQEKINNTSVVLFGLGGFGSHILYNLAFIGFGKIKCVDFDTVNLSNLNRQILYKEYDVGRLKTEAAFENIKEINKDIEYEFVNKKVESKEDIENLILGSDIAILTADLPRDKIFNWANEASFSAKVPMLFTLGFSPRFVRIGPLFIPGKTVCFNCSMPDFNMDFNDEIVQFINNRNEHGSLIPHVSIGSGIIALELVKHITGYEKCMIYNSRINFDIIEYRCDLEHFKPKNNCSFCNWE